MKILLVYPTKLGKHGNPVKYKKAFLPPLSLAILASVTPKQHEVQIINDIVEEIDFSINYDLVGITSMTSQITRAYQIADKFRSLGVPVVIGGIHASCLPNETKEHADSVVIGEADNIWPQIIIDFENNECKDYYRVNERPDLKNMIIPKWENFNMKIYPKSFAEKMPMMPIFTTRGCPYGCSFCSVTKFFGEKYRVKPVENVIEEIKASKAKMFFFVDDNIVCNPKYSRELFKALIPLNIRWFSQVSTTILKDPDLIDLAADSGCFSLFIGLESIDDENLCSVDKKNNKPKDYENLFRLLRKAGIRPYPSMIFGLDNDDKEQFKKTLDFLLKNKAGQASLSILTPLPGTSSFDKMKNDGRLLTQNWALYDLTNIVFKPNKLTEKELYDNFWEIYREFYSYKNIIKRLYYNVQISKTPIREFFNSLFLNTFFRKAVFSYEHPFSGGIHREKGLG